MTSNPNSSHLVAREPSASALLDDFDAVYEKKRAPDEPRSWNPFASAKQAPPPKRRESHSADVDDEPLSPATFANNPFSLRQQAADAGGPELTADGVYGSRDPASPAAHMTANPFGAAHRKKTVDDDPTDFGDTYEKDDAAVGGENPFGAAHRKKKVKDDPTDFGGAYATDGDVAMTANPFAATHDQRKESAAPPRRGTDFHNSKADSVAMRLGKQRHKVRKSTTLQKQDVHVATADVYGEGDGGVAGANPMAKDHSPAEKLTLKLIRTSLVGSPCQTQLAVVHLAEGEHREAAALYDAARAIREARFGPGHPACGSSALAAAEIYGFLGDHERASMLYARAYHSFYKAGPHYRYRANKAWLRCRYESLLRAVSKKPVDDRSWEGLATDAADGAVAVDPDPNFDEFAVEDEGDAAEDDADEGGAITPATPQVDAEDL
jgi:hypothetical protein